MELCTIVRISAPDSVFTDSNSVHSPSGTHSSYPELPSSNDSFVSAMDNDRVVHLEQMVASLQARDIEIQNKLDHFIASMSLLVSAKAEPMMPINQDVPPIANHPKPRKAKPASPPEFGRDRTKGLAFLNSCQTYIRLCPEEFRDEQTKILWAMSYMKVNRAAKWTA